LYNAIIIVRRRAVRCMSAVQVIQIGLPVRVAVRETADNLFWNDRGVKPKTPISIASLLPIAPSRERVQISIRGLELTVLAHARGHHLYAGYRSQHHIARNFASLQAVVGLHSGA
jgi:hypothetical protein